MNDSDFQKVKYKRKIRKINTDQILQKNCSQLSDTDFDIESAFRKISTAKVEVNSTDLYASVLGLLKEGLCALQNPLPSEIICLGIGKVGECLTARYQFAVILNLSEYFGIKITVYDPIFTKNDIALISKFNVDIFDENLEGKYKITNNKSVIFYMPHCSKQLTNNLLWVNWGLNLKYCIIMSNSFSKVIESNTNKDIKAKANYILKISPYVLELAIVNSFKHYEVFNDMALHVFPKLNLICNDLWEDCSEPVYTENDTEFVTNHNKLKY